MESNLINTSAEIKELYNLLSTSNHWMIREKYFVLRLVVGNHHQPLLIVNYNLRIART